MRITCFPKVYFEEIPELLSFFSSGARGQRAGPRESLETWDLRRYLELATGVLRRGGGFLQWELEDGEGKKGIICLEVSTWGLCIVYCSADYMILFVILFYYIDTIL